MALIIETGSGSPNAESYSSVEEADNYFSKRGIMLWTQLSEPEKEQMLVRATDFMIQEYRARWAGRRLLGDQALDWPRVGVVMNDGPALRYLPHNSIPLEVKNACAELALRASIATLSEDMSPRVLQETVGPITVKYDQYAPVATQYTSVVSMLKPFFKSGSGGMMVKLGRC